MPTGGRALAPLPQLWRWAVERSGPGGRGCGAHIPLLPRACPDSGSGRGAPRHGQPPTAAWFRGVGVNG